MISLIVYSVTLRSAPPKLRWRINGRPTALWRVWWVMVYGHQRNAAFLRDLLHDLGFANARRAHQQNRPLADGRNQRGSGIVHGKVCLDRVFNFLFGAFDVHGGTLLHQNIRNK